MADAAAPAATGTGWGSTLKTIFTMGAIGTVMTFGGTILLPFFGASAGGAAAATGATNASVLGSFWAPLFTSTTGEMGLTAGLGKMASGVGAFFNSAATVVSAAFDPSTTMKEALFAPVA